MKTTSLTTLFIKLITLVFVCHPATANDGVFSINGNQLVPLQETQIELKKEILTIKKVDEEFVEITVDFTFFNPGKPKTETVGFVYRNEKERMSDTPADVYFKDFATWVNDVAKSHKTQTLDKKAYKLAHESPDYKLYNVHYFPVSFAKGETKILHKYKLIPSSMVGTTMDLTYILTTGARWANKQIDDFTLHIDLGENALYSINTDLDSEPMQWSSLSPSEYKKNPSLALQVGRNTEMYKDISMGTGTTGTNRMSFSQAAQPITFKKKNFKPQSEMSLSIEDRGVFGHEDWATAFPNLDKDFAILYKDLGKGGMNNSFTSYYRIKGVSTKKALSKLSEKQLKFIRNLPYARRGYIFKDPDLNNAYGELHWYIPRKNVQVNLSKEEQEYIRMVKSLSEKGSARSHAEVLVKYFKIFAEKGVKTDAPEFTQSLNALKKITLPADVDSEALTQLMIGHWQSTRHTYIYEKGGRWKVNPAVGTTEGSWRIKGNQLIKTYEKPTVTKKYTLVLLDPDFYIIKDDMNTIFFNYRTLIE